jgi:signal transduction histidine kinase
MESRYSLRSILSGIIGVVLLLLLYFIQTYNFTFFHVITELFSSLIALSVFLVGWNSRHRIENSVFLFLGIAFLFIGGIDLLHLFSLEGTGIIADGNVNTSTQLVIAGRYLESISFILAVFFAGELYLQSRINKINRDRRIVLAFSVYLLAILSILGLIFVWNVFPDAYNQETGVTRFKFISSYINLAVLLVSAVVIHKRKDMFSHRVFKLLFLAITLLIVTKLPFSVYTNFSGGLNAIGHYTKIVSYYLLYLAIVKTGITNPQEMLYLELQKSKEREELLGSILRHDILNKLQLIRAYQESIEEDLPESSKEQFTYAMNATEEAEELIRKIQTLTSLETLDSSMSIALDPLLTDAIDQQRDLASENDTSLEYQPVESEVIGTNLLQEAFSNLIQNALLHSDGDRIQISGESRGDELVISIEDNGVGIPDARKENLFDNDVRSSDEASDVGLLLVHEIIEMCGGSIEVTDSTLGGAKFGVHLQKA